MRYRSSPTGTNGILRQIATSLDGAHEGAISGEGVALNLQDFVQLLRSRWVTVCVTTLVVVLGAVAVTLLTTPLYQASTRLFVSTTAGASLPIYTRAIALSQERVLSYTELLTGETLAQRTIDKLGLDMSAEALQKNVKASAKPDYGPDRCNGP